MHHSTLGLAVIKKQKEERAALPREADPGLSSNVGCGLASRFARELVKLPTEHWAPLRGNCPKIL